MTVRHRSVVAAVASVPRRAIVAAAAVAAGAVATLAVAVAPAAAQSAGSAWTSPLATVTSPDLVLAGRFAATSPEWAALDSVHVSVRWAGDGALPDGCTVPAPRTVPLAGSGETRTFSVPARLACNGDYVAAARAITPTGDCPAAMDCPALPDLAVAVAAPGPAPTGLAAEADDEEPSPVALTWRRPSDPPADSLDTYRVERSSDGGPFTVVATTRPGVTSWRDEAVAETGGSFAYRVVALRAGPGGGAVASAPSAPVGAHVVAPPDAGPSPGPGPGDGGPGGDGGTGATPGAGSPGGGSGGAPVWPGGIDLTPPPAPGTRPSPGAALPLTPPTTGDGGYEPTLDYGATEQAAPGGTVTRFAEGESGAGTVVQRFVEDGDDRRRVLLPVAAAMALLVGAAQLHHLGRRARAVAAPPSPPAD